MLHGTRREIAQSRAGTAHSRKQYLFYRIGQCSLPRLLCLWGEAPELAKKDGMIVFTKSATVAKQRTAVSIMAVFLAGATFLPAQQSPQVDVKQLVRSMIENELDNSHRDQVRWMYRLQRREGDKSTVKEVVETKTCDIHFLLSLNGDALTPDQRQKENERLEKLVNDPEEQRKKKHEQQEDDHKAVEMFKMLPEAFLYRYGGNRGSLVELAFWPNPDFHPPSREAHVFHGMEGTMWVDAEKKRLVELDGHLAQDVEFLGGVFGHLDKGGRFTVRRSELAPGQWVVTGLIVEITGQALIFKSINLRQTDSMSDFRRVPADLNPAQAADMLKRGSVPEVAGELAAGDTSTRAVR